MSEEQKAFFDEVKKCLLNTLPHIAVGYILTVLISGLLLKTNSIEFLLSVAETGVYIFSLFCCYYMGKSTWLLVNHVFSRKTSERRTEG